MEEEGEKVLAVLKKSRKFFLIEYACSLVLLVFSGVLYYKGVSLPRNVYLVVIGLALIIIIWAEVSRFYHRYIVTPTKITFIHGLLRQHKKHVYFQPLGFVPDINVHQNMVQRLLDYGTISIMSSPTNSFDIKDVNNPQRILRMLENLIEENKTTSSRSKSLGKS